jgi:hypothetical protein
MTVPDWRRANSDRDLDVKRRDRPIWSKATRQFDRKETKTQVSDLDTMFDEVDQAVNLKRKQMTCLRTPMNVYEPDDEKRNADKGFCSGDMRVQAILECLDSFGLKRSEDQKLFHRNFLVACLPKIYGTEWDQHKRRVLEEFGMTTIDFEVMIITPRRWGKTVSVATFVTAVLLCVPGIEIGIFSTGSRASGSLMEKIISYLDHIPGSRERIVKSNQEDLFLALQSIGGLSAKSDLAIRLRTAPGTSKLHRCDYLLCFIVMIPFLLP